MASHGGHEIRVGVQGAVIGREDFGDGGHEFLQGPGDPKGFFANPTPAFHFACFEQDGFHTFHDGVHPTELLMKLRYNRVQFAYSFLHDGQLGSDDMRAWLSRKQNKLVVQVGPVIGETVCGFHAVDEH